jgi:hypothetical protein
MPARPIPEEKLQDAARFYIEAGRCAVLAAKRAGVPRQTFENWLAVAAARGILERRPDLPGYFIRSFSQQLGPDGEVQKEWVNLAQEREASAPIPDGHVVKGLSTYVDGQGNVVGQWIKTKAEFDTVAAIKAAIEEFRTKLPRVKPTKGPAHVNSLLLNQYTITDFHLSARAWGEETGGDNYDTEIAEQLLVDWFSAAIAMAPNASMAVFAQLGDFLHYDSMESVTPEHGNVLDADSRFQKVVRVAIRVIRRIIGMLLAKHERVHIIMAAGNHDPASSAWLRELLFALYEDEPRITVDNSPSVYYAFEWGKTALFYHHGHRRKAGDVDGVFAGRFREMFGRCPFSYAHLGHLHNDAVRESPLMRIERHRTLAAPDAYAANGGWLSQRDAKVISYHKHFGEVGRVTVSPQMVRSREAA